MDAPMVSQLKAIECGASAIGSSAASNENCRLKRMYAELGMQNDLLNCEGERHWSERT